MEYYREEVKTVPRKVEVDQAEVTIGKQTFIVTHIPTATAGSWFVVHDACEIWAAVAIEDCTGDVIGWRCPPDKHQKEIEDEIKKAFGIPVPY